MKDSKSSEIEIQYFSNMMGASSRKGLSYLNIRGLWISIFLSIYYLTSFGQACDYLPGDVTLLEEGGQSSPFYNTSYFLVDITNDSILQVQSSPIFDNLKKGDFAAYAVNYKIRDSIANLAIGNLLQDIQSNCLALSPPFNFNVCAPPILSNIEAFNLTICADSTRIGVSDSIRFMDADENLDTFSIIISISQSPDISNDNLDVDISAFIGLSKNFMSPTLVVNNISSPSQVQAILRAIHFFSTSIIQGDRVLTVEVTDGKQNSNVLEREIIVNPLPQQVIQIFRKKED